MAVQHLEIVDLASAQRAIDAPALPAGFGLLITIATTVPAWLPDVVALARTASVQIAVQLAPAGSGADAEVRDGWEIGVLTAVLTLGLTDVRGVDPVRIRRVAAVVAALSDAAVHRVAT